jgi:SAM-dependent methyltransferase
LIRVLQNARDAGRPTHLFLCFDSEDLRARPNVKEGGLMGCRTPHLSFHIDHFRSSLESVALLDELPPGSVAAFDEASWFGPGIVQAWVAASERGVEVIVSSISPEQVSLLERHGCYVTTLITNCVLCGKADGRNTLHGFEENIRLHLAVCDACFRAIEANRARPSRSAVEPLVGMLRDMKPFPGEDHAYQPLIDVHLPGWTFVRSDTPTRADLIWDTLRRAYPSLCETMLTFIDLGCCTGYFCEYMAARGYRSVGVDINRDFIDLAKQLSALRQSGVTYEQRGALDFIRATPDQPYDIIASFATVQWLIAQNGMNAGYQCLDWLFSNTRRMCVFEMGYSNEAIYKDKLPYPIDRAWVLCEMKERGHFDQILVFPEQTRGIWRDLFIGLRAPEVAVDAQTIAATDNWEPVSEGVLQRTKRAAHLAHWTVQDFRRAVDKAIAMVKDNVRKLRHS